jgi:hypothetical protein
MMAWIEKRGTKFRVNFRYGGRHYGRSLKTSYPTKAETPRLRLEVSLSELERGRLEHPPDADLITFLLSDGKLRRSPKAMATPKTVSLGDFRDKYPVEMISVVISPSASSH